MPKLIITVGVSGSGKSTYAKELVAQGWKEINRDWWRFKLFTEGVNDWSLYKFTKEKEKLVTKRCLEDWETAQVNGYDVVISNTNLTRSTLNDWVRKGMSAGYEVEVKYFPITFEEMLKRNEKRGALAVKREVLIQQWQKWLEITNFKRYEPDDSKPKAIWVDLDGTLATHNQRGHHDYSKVIDDSPRLGIISMIQAWAEKDNLEIVFMSGRPDSCKADTTKWLLRYFDSVDYLYMRKDGDMRSDRIVKEELFWQYLEPHWNIIGSVDDRPKIIRLQKDLGIENVIDVSEKYIEF